MTPIPDDFPATPIDRIRLDPPQDGYPALWFIEAQPGTGWRVSNIGALDFEFDRLDWRAVAYLRNALRHVLDELDKLAYLRATSEAFTPPQPTESDDERIR